MFEYKYLVLHYNYHVFKQNFKNQYFNKCVKYYDKLYEVNQSWSSPGF